ncbi:MAG TPA: hypothetical protein VFB34_02295 [Chloroflexota bacterium]|nr:hypothetical protein [Chloroflexota bacterium]
MSWLAHSIETYLWQVGLVVGFVFAALVWVGMALWDGVRNAVRRLFGG